MNHDGCMHPDYCTSRPGIVATLAMNSDLLPLAPDARAKLVNDLEHLAEMLSIYAAELRKGEHGRTTQAVFYERVAGLGPALLFTHA